MTTPLGRFVSLDRCAAETDTLDFLDVFEYKGCAHHACGNMDCVDNDPCRKAVPMRSHVLRFFPSQCLVMLFGLALCMSALAQTPVVPRSGFSVGLGGSYNSMNFGTQDVDVIGTS